MTTRSFQQTLLILMMLLTFACANEPGSDHRPVISPDGQTVVFMSTREKGDWELFSISADGKGLKRLTKNTGWDGYAVWAPEGRSFIYDREVGDARGAYVYDLETGAISPFIVLDNAKVAVSGWSSRGGKVVMFIERDNKRDLYLSEFDGSKLQQLTDTANANEHDAHFSPDGSKIAYAVAFKGGSALDVMDLATGEVSRHITSTQNLYGLDWSPDGRQIAYTDTPNDNPDGNAELYILNVTDSAVLQLTDDENYNHMPVWLHDGSGIMFSSYVSGREEIYIFDLENSDVRKFPTGLQ